MTIGLITLVTIISLGLIGYGYYHHVKEKIKKELTKKSKKKITADVIKNITKRVSSTSFPSTGIIISFISVIMIIAVRYAIFSSIQDTVSTLNQRNYTLTQILKIVPGFSSMFGVMATVAMAFFTLGFLRRAV